MNHGITLWFSFGFLHAITYGLTTFKSWSSVLPCIFTMITVTAMVSSNVFFVHTMLLSKIKNMITFLYLSAHTPRFINKTTTDTSSVLSVHTSYNLLLCFVCQVLTAYTTRLETTKTMIACSVFRAHIHRVTTTAATVCCYDLSVHTRRMISIKTMTTCSIIKT